MKKNVGLLDSVIRLLVAIVLVDVAVNKGIATPWNIFAWLFASIFFLTALVGRCPFYSLIGINTCPNKKSGHGEKIS